MERRRKPIRMVTLQSTDPQEKAEARAQIGPTPIPKDQSFPKQKLFTLLSILRRAVWKPLQLLKLLLALVTSTLSRLMATVAATPNKKTRRRRSMPPSLLNREEPSVRTTPSQRMQPNSRMKQQRSKRLQRQTFWINSLPRLKTLPAANLTLNPWRPMLLHLRQSSFKKPSPRSARSQLLQRMRFRKTLLPRILLPNLHNHSLPI